MENNNIKTILDGLRSEFIIIGLTGALGSGCTETAKFLSDEDSSTKINNILHIIPKDEFDLEYRKLQRVDSFYKDEDWGSFFHIRVSDILFLILVNNIDSFSDYKNILKDKENDNFDEINELSKEFVKLIQDYTSSSNNNIKNIMIKTNEYISVNIDKSSDEYTTLFQKIGKNIRTSGSVLDNSSHLVSKLKLDPKYNDLNIFIIPEIIRRVIKLVRKKNEIEKKKDFFVIDALRNIYEIEFFRNRYQSFYLFSIMASESTRDSRILNSFKLNIDELKIIKDVEKNDKGIESQAINSCIGKGDVFINNDINDPSRGKLHLQIIKYIALVRKPGLITPSDDERFMQVAFTARYNSGCISRQVGAAVVGSDGYIRGFGWNDTPENHIPCLYRTPQQLLSTGDNMIFSNYERSEIFFNYMKGKYENKSVRNLPYCFKDNQSQIELTDSAKKIKHDISCNDINHEISQDDIKKILEKAKFKNPTRERALHAEENAFLQISKSGGQTVIDGTLYSTDSPCQLCSKKTMQLKINRVVYIDAYPDISLEHTLRAGEDKYWPKFEMFSGAIGSAYFKLFVPIIGRKDEIKELDKLK